MNTVGQADRSEAALGSRHLDLLEARAIVQADKGQSTRAQGTGSHLELEGYATFTYQAIECLQAHFGQFAVHVALFANPACQPVFPVATPVALSGPEMRPEMRGTT